MYKISKELINLSVKMVIKKQNYSNLFKLIVSIISYFILIIFLVGIFYFDKYIYKNIEWTIGNNDFIFYTILTLGLLLPFYILSKVKFSSNLFRYKTFGSFFKFFLFLFFLTFGFYWIFDILIRENTAKKIYQKEIMYNTKLMCNYHLKILIDDIETYTLLANESTQKIFFSKDQVKDFRDAKLDLKFISFSSKFGYDNRNEPNRIIVTIKNNFIKIGF
jgi:hypothetical protein